MYNNIINPLATQIATISSGASVSDDQNLGGLRLFGIVMPSAWTTANLTFQMSPDNGTTWADVYDKDGNELSFVAVANHYIALDPTNFAPLRLLRVRSGTGSTPVAQGAVRSLTLVVRAL